MNSTANLFETTNKSYVPVVLFRDTFAKAFIKNLIVVLVWFILSSINISVVVTFFMLVAIFTTRNSPLILASMAIERYIAICDPLRHAQICTVRRTYVLICLTWLLCMVTETSDLFVTLTTESISFFYTSVFCLRKNVFRAPNLTSKMKALDCLYFSVVFLTLVYTYLRVLFAARAMSTDRSSALKARRTILLHGAQLLMCVLSYIYPSIEAVLITLFPAQMLDIRYSTYLIVYILPRFLSPIIYGVRDSRFRKYLKRNFRCGQMKVKPNSDRGEENIRK